MYFIENPATNDILCGKDKTYGKHPGNRLYRALIEAKAIPYGQESSKQVKMRMTKEIVDTMWTGHGARFLRKVDSNNCWEEITNQQARDKTSHALRFCAASHRRKQSHQAINAAVAPTTPGAVNKRRRGRKTHRRTVSNDSSTAASNTPPQATAAVMAYPEVTYSSLSVTTSSVFPSQRGDTLHNHRHHHHHHTAYTFDDDHACGGGSIEPIPCPSSIGIMNRMQSADLEQILQEPINEEQDWDGLFVMEA